MKFIGFTYSEDEEYAVVLFSSAVEHSRVLNILRSIAPKLSIYAVQAGSMRWNGEKFYDCDSSFSLKLSSGSPRNTEQLNKMVDEGKSFPYLFNSEYDGVFIFDTEVFSKEELEQFLHGELTLKLTEQENLQVDELHLNNNQELRENFQDAVNVEAVAVNVLSTRFKKKIDAMLATASF